MGVTFVLLSFFQAEDGIRDYKVTGVQTCALPICNRLGQSERGRADQRTDWDRAASWLHPFSLACFGHGGAGRLGDFHYYQYSFGRLRFSRYLERERPAYGSDHRIQPNLDYREWNFDDDDECGLIDSRRHV